ncbi:MAG: zinc-ribbon domain-containing protein [Methanothermobacter tenebrarum]|nr:hypothetical protein [Methanobacteriaceae archaeon]BAW32129.1 adenylate/guanylate cyclase [Methanothermobacter sp. MT-2]
MIIKESIASERLKICPNCGIKNLEAARFCIECNQQIDKTTHEKLQGAPKEKINAKRIITPFTE